MRIKSTITKLIVILLMAVLTFTSTLNNIYADNPSLQNVVVSGDYITFDTFENAQGFKVSWTQGSFSKSVIVKPTDTDYYCKSLYKVRIDLNKLFADNDTPTNNYDVTVAAYEFDPEQAISEDYTSNNYSFTSIVGDSTCTHDFSSKIKKSTTVKVVGTCNNEAIHYYSCSKCGALEKNDERTFTGDKDPMNHGVNGVRINNKTIASCEREGNTGDKICDGCGEFLEIGIKSDKLPHTLIDGWIYDNIGHWKKCSVCSMRVDSSAHEYGADDICDVCGFDKTSIPYLISGDNGKYTLGSSEGLTFVSSADYETLESVYVDNKLVSLDDYTSSEGSTIITLLPTFLETLAKGSHTIVIMSSPGKVTANFVIEEKVIAKPSTPTYAIPKTGVN